MARKTSPELEAKIVEYAKKADDARLRILAEKFNVSVQLVATICKRNNIKRSVKWKWQTARDRRVIWPTILAALQNTKLSSREIARQHQVPESKVFEILGLAKTSGVHLPSHR